jgi:hypothetical protein
VIRPGPQSFVYSFNSRRAAQLDRAVVYNYGEQSGVYSKGLEFYGSDDGASWFFITNGVLANATGAQSFGLSGGNARHIKVTVTSGYLTDFWELGEIEVYGTLECQNLALPANGGRLESFTSQYDSENWAASHLTDGVKQGSGGSWASVIRPGPQSFVYSFSNQQLARLDNIVIYDYGENEAYYSKGIELFISYDGVAWTSIANGVLTNEVGAQIIRANGSNARFVKITLTSGYLNDYWELGEIEVIGTLIGQNLVLPANGGRLESFTSQFDSGNWAASRLTDSVKQGIGGSWASVSRPGPQSFVYSFSNHRAAQLNQAVVYNYGEQSGVYSKGLEFYGSDDGANWFFITNGVLSNAIGAQSIGLGGSNARYVKMTVASGYFTDYWELGEVEVYGTLVGQNLVLPANGGSLESFTSQFDSGNWAAIHLTDGVRQGIGGSWASVRRPGPQSFVYSFSNRRAAQLDRAVLYNYGEQSGVYSKGLEFYGSDDGASWFFISNGTLANAIGAQSFGLGSSNARYIKVTLTSGYLTDYWELGEVEVYGSLE